jgi:hypothetical protein
MHFHLQNRVKRQRLISTKPNLSSFNDEVDSKIRGFPMEQIVREIQNKTVMQVSDSFRINLLKIAN